MGHILSDAGLKIDEQKVSAIQKMEPPKDIKELKMFMGMINYVSKFVPNMSEQTKNLRILEKKDVLWHWGTEQQRDFDRIK